MRSPEIVHCLRFDTADSTDVMRADIEPASGSVSVRVETHGTGRLTLTYAALRAAAEFFTQLADAIDPVKEPAS